MSVPHSLRKQPRRCLSWVIHLLVLTFALLSSPALAQRLTWRPTDFRPLTELPWKDESLPMPQVLEMIFKEPNLDIRHAVLVGYLRTLPVEKFDAAFELCTTYEGCQNPADVVSLLLEIWAERDPEAAWKKTEALFGATVIDADPLHLDNWNRPKIRVVNHAALQKSPFWLERNTLGNFQHGLQISKLEGDRKKQLIEAFEKRCLEAFGDLVSDSEIPTIATRLSPRMLEVLSASESELRRNILDSGQRQLKTAHVEASALRWLALKPAKALEILKTVEEADWPVEGDFQGPSGVFFGMYLRLWSKLDFAAVLQWTETQEIKKSKYGSEARAVLLSRVDKTTRQRWLQAAKDKDSAYYPLYNDWMVWNPEDALQACVAADDPELLLEAAEVTAYTVSNAYNMSHWGLGVIRDFDLKTAAAKWMKPDGGIGEWGYQIMERWYAIDIGEAARYGFHFLTVQWPDYMPREDLIKMFSGDPECCSDSDMIDRTLCCMRFWAMWKPNEMRKWIETVKEADMRKALTWTLENPWGNGEE